MAEEVDNGRQTVDLVWAKRPKKDVWQKVGGRRELVAFSLIPKILRDIGPENPLDFRVARKNDNAAVAEIVSKESSSSRAALAKAANSIQLEERDYSKDSERIQNKANEGIPSLIAARKLIHTSRGSLRLLLEILRLSVEQGDRVSAYDLLWAIENSDALKNYDAELNGGGAVDAVEATQGDSEERYKALVKEAKAMKQAKLADECKKRGLATKGSKDDLLARLRDALKEESKAEPAKKIAVAEPAAKPKKIDKNSEAGIINDFYDKIVLVRRWRAEEPDMIKKQLTEMSHLLPPLSPFASSFKLDAWQERVLNLIDQEKSVLICAPTSSGKTVLSSYVAIEKREIQGNVPASEDEEAELPPEELLGHSGKSVLFIVPSDPLVWQVGALFAKYKGLAQDVALVTDRLSYAPHLRQNRPASVVVGTPLALENAMTKIRGKSGSWLEDVNKSDYSQLIGGFDHYKWVVYDEVHSLGADTPDGLALQRLIKALKCNFLALSATVGNAEELRSWLERVRGEQVSAEAITVNADTPVGSEVKMEIHEGRFINLQRHVWTTPASGGELDLAPLHPLSAVSLDFFSNGGFSKSSLPMTPQDSYTLWLSMTKFYDMAAIADLDPHTFFQGKERITLLKAKDYETHMKNGLERLAISQPEQTANLLRTFVLEDLPSEFNIYDLLQKLKTKDSAGNDKMPCIVFHLDIMHLIGRFQELLYGLESKQREMHPKYYEALEGRRRMAGAELEACLASCATDEEKEDLMKESETLSTVDTEQPHPDFVLNNRSPISRQEYEEILKDIAFYDFGKDFAKAKAHPLLRALRRGFGLYIDDVSFQSYKRAVMRLATKGKLAVVFSDESLAFGVNMPFRTCVFCGDMGGRLNTLLVQQMSGRAGRRGLDTQGHLVYAGAKADFVRNMVISRIPAVKGSDPRYLTMFLQQVCSQFSNPKGFPTQTDVMGRLPLCEFVDQARDGFNMNERSRDLMLALNFIEECDVMTEEALDMFDYSVTAFERSTSSPSGYRPRAPYNPSVLWAIWTMRDRLAESVMVAKLLPLLWRDFAGPQKSANYGDSVDVQFEFVATLLHIVDRRPALPDGLVLSENAYITSSTVVKRQELRSRLEIIESEILKHNNCIEELDRSGRFPTVSRMLVPAVGEGVQLDGTLLHCFITGNTDVVPYSQKHDIKERLWDLGCFLRSLHNALWPDKNKFGKLSRVCRKCFMRIQYLSGDNIRDAIDFTNVSAYELEGKDVSQISDEIVSRIAGSLRV